MSENHSLSSLRDRDQDSIPFRIEFIKELLRGKKLDPIVEFDNCETEQFVNIGGGDGDNNSKDTRQVLNKKSQNFYKIIKKELSKKINESFVLMEPYVLKGEKIPLFSKETFKKPK